MTSPSGAAAVAVTRLSVTGLPPAIQLAVFLCFALIAAATRSNACLSQPIHADHQVTDLTHTSISGYAVIGAVLANAITRLITRLSMMVESSTGNAIYPALLLYKWLNMSSILVSQHFGSPPDCQPRHRHHHAAWLAYAAADQPLP